MARIVQQLIPLCSNSVRGVIPNRTQDEYLAHYSSHSCAKSQVVSSNNSLNIEGKTRITRDQVL